MTDTRSPLKNGCNRIRTSEVSDVKKTKKTVIICAAAAFAAIAVLAVIFIETRQSYWKNRMPESQSLKQSDAEYLGVWDLRLISSNDDDDYLLDLGEKLCRSANDESHSNENKDIISDENFNKLDFSKHFPMEMAKTSEYSIIETDILTKGDKAIFFCRDKYKGFDADGKEVFGGENSSFPLRIYFEKENGTWKVTDVDFPL